MLPPSKLAGTKWPENDSSQTRQCVRGERERDIKYKLPHYRIRKKY